MFIGRLFVQVSYCFADIHFGACIALFRHPLFQCRLHGGDASAFSFGMMLFSSQGSFFKS